MIHTTVTKHIESFFVEVAAITLLKHDRSLEIVNGEAAKYLLVRTFDDIATVRELMTRLT